MDTCSNLFQKLEKKEASFKASYVLMTKNEGEQFRDKNYPQKLIELITRTNNMIKGSLKIPQNIELVIYPKLDTTEIKYQPFVNRIYFAEQLSTSANGKYFFHNPSYNKASLYHEYGHHIFTHNLKSSVHDFDRIETSYLNAEKIDSDLEKVREELGQIINDIGQILPAKITESSEYYLKKRQWEHAVNSRDGYNLESLYTVEDFHNHILKVIPEDQKPQLSKLIGRFKELNSNYSENYVKLVETLEDEIMAKQQRYYKNLLPYNELFADTVSVLMTENPNSISKVFNLPIKLQNQGGLKEHLYTTVKFRQFDEVRKINFNNEKYNLTQHDYLYLTRQFLWDEYLSKPTILKNKKRRSFSGTLSSNLESRGYTNSTEFR